MCTRNEALCTSVGLGGPLHSLRFGLLLRLLHITASRLLAPHWYSHTFRKNPSTWRFPPRMSPSHVLVKPLLECVVFRTAFHAAMHPHALHPGPHSTVARALTIYTPPLLTRGAREGRGDRGEAPLWRIRCLPGTTPSTILRRHLIPIPRGSIQRSITISTGTTPPRRAAVGAAAATSVAGYGLLRGAGPTSRSGTFPFLGTTVFRAQLFAGNTRFGGVRAGCRPCPRSSCTGGDAGETSTPPAVRQLSWPCSPSLRRRDDQHRSQALHEQAPGTELESSSDRALTAFAVRVMGVRNCPVRCYLADRLSVSVCVLCYLIGVCARCVRQ
jgi:hypothetical protein